MEDNIFHNMIPTEDEIKKIVNKSFYDLGYKKKFTKEYYEELANTTLNNIDWSLVLKSESEDTVEDEKCSKPHMQSLPYDGNARTEGKLNRRKEALENRITEEEDNLKKNKEELKKLQKEAGNLKRLQEGKKRFDEIFVHRNDLMHIEDRIDKIEKDYDRMEGEFMSHWLSDLGFHHNSDKYPRGKDSDSWDALKKYLEDGLKSGKFHSNYGGGLEAMVESRISEIDDYERIFYWAKKNKDDVIKSIKEIPFDDIRKNPSEYYGNDIPGHEGLERALDIYRDYVRDNVILDYRNLTKREFESGESEYSRATAVYESCDKINRMSRGGNEEFKEANVSKWEGVDDKIKVNQDNQKKIKKEIESSKNRIDDYKEELGKVNNKLG